MKRSAFISLPILLSVVLAGGLGLLGGWWALPDTFVPSASSSPSVTTSTQGPASAGTSSSSSASSTASSSTALSPSSGPIGTLVTVHGTGFTASSTVELRNLAGAGVVKVASDGTWLTFAVPQSLGPVCHPGEICAQFIMMVGEGGYPVTVVTAGNVFDAGTFTVTGSSLGKFPRATGGPVQPESPANR